MYTLEVWVTKGLIHVIREAHTISETCVDLLLIVASNPFTTVGRVRQLGADDAANHVIRDFCAQVVVASNVILWALSSSCVHTGLEIIVVEHPIWAPSEQNCVRARLQHLLTLLTLVEFGAI